MPCENGIESWLPILQRNIAQTIQSELDRIFGCHDDDGDEDDERLSSNSNNGDRSIVITHLLKTLFPLPENWSIEANSDAVAVSIKLMMSTLLSESFDHYVQGDKSALDRLVANLNNTVVALSKFLFDQTKVKIRRKNLSSRGDGYDCTTRGSDDVNSSLDIAASLVQTPTPLQVQSSKMTAPSRSGDGGNIDYGDKDYNLRPHQTKMIRNFVQILMGEVHFVQELKQTLELGYNLKQRLPFEWHIHPRFVLCEDNADPVEVSSRQGLPSVQVLLGQHAVDYAFQFQGVTNFVASVFLAHERALHRLVCTMLDDSGFSYTLSSQVSLDCVFVL